MTVGQLNGRPALRRQTVWLTREQMAAVFASTTENIRQGEFEVRRLLISQSVDVPHIAGEYEGRIEPSRRTTH